MINKERMIEILSKKIDEGYEIVEKTSIVDKNFSLAVVNMFELDKTISDLKKQIENENNEIEKMENEPKVTKEEYEEIERALSKNKEVRL